MTQQAVSQSTGQSWIRTFLAAQAEAVGVDPYCAEAIQQLKDNPYDDGGLLRALATQFSTAHKACVWLHTRHPRLMRNTPKSWILRGQYSDVRDLLPSYSRYSNNGW